MDLESQLTRIVSLKRGFGRAESELDAVVLRARAGDYRGVLQGSRLVVEMLLRALVVDQLKQTAGKQMLEELLQKFQQSAHAGLVPTPVLTHMRTVQAWGNLGSHDHAASLSDEAVRVGREEALTSLNSLVSILSWYAERFGASPPKDPAPALVGSAAPAVTSKRKFTPTHLFGALAVLLLGGGGGAFLLKERAASQRVAEARLALDALYAETKFQTPLRECQASTAGELEALGRIAPAVLRDQAANVTAQLGALSTSPSLSPEGWYLVALGNLQLATAPEQALQAAEKASGGCPSFAAAHALAGKAALTLERPRVADRHYAAAIAADPSLAAPHFNRGLIALRDQRTAEAREHLSRSLALEPKDAFALYLRGKAALSVKDVDAAVGDLEKATALNDRLAPAFFSLAEAYAEGGKTEAAARAFCRSAELGNKAAAARCSR